MARNPTHHNPDPNTISKLPEADNHIDSSQSNSGHRQTGMQDQNGKIHGPILLDRPAKLIAANKHLFRDIRHKPNTYKTTGNHHPLSMSGHIMSLSGTNAKNGQTIGQGHSNQDHLP
jgi:hypothetical protein